MTAPKNDKARKAWLAGLKGGDHAAALDSEGNVTAVGPVTWSAHSALWSLSGRRYTAKTGKREGGTGWLVPVTDEMKKNFELERAASAARDKIRQLSYWDWNRFSSTQILAVSAILWPEVKT